MHLLLTRSLSAEFRHWLKKKHKNFDDFDSREQRHQFRKFVRRWNSNELSERYYSGKYSKPLEAAARSDHKWKVQPYTASTCTGSSFLAGSGSYLIVLALQFADSITGDERQQLAAVKQDNEIDIGPELPEVGVIVVIACHDCLHHLSTPVFTDT